LSDILRPTSCQGFFNKKGHGEIEGAARDRFGCGPDDPCIPKTKEKLKSLGIDANEVGRHLGKQQGLILRELAEATGLKRVCVAGGDTCSYVLRQMDIHSLELLMPITPAAPLCRAFSDNPAFEGLQVASKGGQIGAPEYFLQVLNGQRANL
jgi:3-oxoisoapionate kinase